jgi:uncharacterized protein YcnI
MVPAIADAHIDITSGPGYANTTQLIKFGVGHGCSGVDTYSIKVQIPPGVTSVRPMSSSFGAVSVEADATGVPTSVTWTRASIDQTLPADSAYYELALRAKLPDAPFTTVYFKTIQICRNADGGILESDWVGTDPSDPNVEPAPAVKVVPARKAGWNKIKVAQATTDLAGFFPDALIVWKGTAAFSPNAATTDLINTTRGVTSLTSLSVSDEIWVKY